MTSVYQMMLENGIDEIDVADNTFDEMCAWDMPDDDPYDRNYNAAIEYILKNTEAVKFVDYGSERWIIADVTGFVEKHYDAMKEFTRSCCSDVMDYRSRDDNLEVGVRTINGLVAGYFGETEYRNFLWLMGSRSGAGRSGPPSARRNGAGASDVRAAVRRKAASRSKKGSAPSKKTSASKGSKAKSTPAKKTKGARR